MRRRSRSSPCCTGSLRVAEAEIDAYAPNAPEATRNEAAVIQVGYLYDSPPGTSPVSAFRKSGALGLLSRWHVASSQVVGDDVADDDEADTPLGPSTHPVHPGTHYRYMGWSDGTSIDQAELNAAASFTTDALTVPNRATPGYVFAGFDASAGAPDSAFIDGNPTNQIGNWSEQVTRLERDDEDVVILVTTAELSARQAGRVWTFGYSSP